jgi:hypothetical protein
MKHHLLSIYRPDGDPPHDVLPCMATARQRGGGGARRRRAAPVRRKQQGPAALRPGAERAPARARREVGAVTPHQSSGPDHEAKLFRICVDVT